MNERRQAIRVVCKLPTQLRNVDSLDIPQPITSALVMNISIGGVCIQIDEFLPMQCHLTVYLQLPNQPAVEIHATPVWIAKLPHSDKYEIGARFVEMRAENEDAIQNYQYQTLLERIPKRTSQQAL